MELIRNQRRKIQELHRESFLGAGFRSTDEVNA